MDLLIFPQHLSNILCIYIKHQSENHTTSEPNIKIINHFHIQRNRNQLEELILRERDSNRPFQKLG